MPAAGTDGLPGVVGVPGSDMWWYVVRLELEQSQHATVNDGLTPVILGYFDGGYTHTLRPRIELQQRLTCAGKAG